MLTIRIQICLIIFTLSSSNLSYGSNIDSLKQLLAKTHDLERAKYYYEIALKYFEEQGDLKGATGVTIVLGNIALVHDDLPDAMYYYLNTVDLAILSGLELSPSDAGTLTPDDNEATLFVADDWTGDFTIKVRATNMCGDGDWSDDLDGTVYQSPSSFALEGGGGYCLNEDGVEITLDGSENDIDYELYLDGVATGNVVEGTGTDISFGLITEEGFYKALASNDNCDYPMDGQLQVEILFPPLEPGMPTGPEVICEEETSDYTSAGSDDTDSYEWENSPEDAGTITANGLDATVEWNTEFSYWLFSPT